KSQQGRTSPCWSIRSTLACHYFHIFSDLPPRALQASNIPRGETDIALPSRGADCVRVVGQATLGKREGAGKAGCPLHPQPRTQTKSARASSPQVRRTVRPSPRNGFNGL